MLFFLNHNPLMLTISSNPNLDGLLIDFSYKTIRLTYYLLTFTLLPIVSIFFRLLLLCIIHIYFLFLQDLNEFNYLNKLHNLKELHFIKEHHYHYLKELI